MDALAQEAEGFGQAPAEVWGIVQQWPILLLFLAGFAFAYWLFVVRKKGDDESPDGNGHADLRAFIGAKFDDLGNQVEGLRAGLETLTTDFKEHARQDRESFRELYDRTSPREAWTTEERTRRAAGGRESR